MRPTEVTLQPLLGSDVSRNGPSRRKPTNPNSLPVTSTIIALDPGGTTGWSLITVDPESLLPDSDRMVLSSIEKWDHGQIDCGSKKGNLGVSRHEGISTSGEAAGVNEILGLLRAWPGACVVIESFILRQFSKDPNLLSPVRITASIAQDLWMHRRYYFTQSPAEAKTTATDERLKNWELYDSHGGMNHARDADRHAITFLRKACQASKVARELREQAWPHLYLPGRAYGPE